MSKLKPCPFCGEPPSTDTGERNNRYDIYCSNIDCATAMHPSGCDREWLISLWNNRIGTSDGKKLKRIKEIIDEG